MEKVLEYCWKARENFKHENPGVDPASFEDLQDHKPLFYQPAGPLPTLEEHREINHADVNVHGNSSPQEVLKILRARKDQKTLHAYYTLVEDRLSGKSKPEDMLEGINPDSSQLEIALFNWGNHYREPLPKRSRHKVVSGKPRYPLVAIPTMPSWWKPTD